MVVQALRHVLGDGVRSILRRPFVTLVGVASLALGIGVSTAVFSIVHAVVFAPLPFHDPDRLVALTESSVDPSETKGRVSAYNYLDWKAQTRSFAGLASYCPRSFDYMGGEYPERISGAVASTDFFTVLGAGAMRGRVFTTADWQSGGSGLAVISFRSWRVRFGSDPNLVGEDILLDAQIFRVVGVLEEDFHPLPAGAEVWTMAQTLVPLPGRILNTMDQLERSGSARAYRYLNVIGRLAKGSDLEEAKVDLETVAVRLTETYPRENEGWKPRLQPLAAAIVGEADLPLLVMFGAACLMMLVACINVANLLLARSDALRRDLAIRASLGAGVGRLIGRSLVSGLILALVGGLMGLSMAALSMGTLRALLPQDLPRAWQVGFNLDILVFGLGASLLTGLVFGLIPAGGIIGRRYAETLSQGSRQRSTPGRSRKRVLDLILIAQVALSLILLIAAGLLTQSFLRLRDVNPGFDGRRLLVARIAGIRPNLDLDPLLMRLASMPGALSAARAADIPFTGRHLEMPFVAEERTEAKDAKVSAWHFVDSGYFRTLGLDLLRGRAFAATDTPAGDPVAIISEGAAAVLWPDGEDPLGRRISLYSKKGGFWWVTVVGIVPDIRYSDIRQEPIPAVYSSMSQNPMQDFYFLLRTSADPSLLAADLRRSVAEAVPNRPLTELRTMPDIQSDSIEGLRFQAALVNAFSVTALLLAVAGVFGTTLYNVSQRTHEFAIRTVLGAAPRRIARSVLIRVCILGTIGCALGMAGALGLNRFLSGMLYGVNASDPWTFAGVAVFFLAAALAAGYPPARRATRFDAITLRAE